MSRSEERGDRARDAGAATPPETAKQALERARDHALRSLSEAILALRALLDAASLATGGGAADSRSGLSSLAGGLDEVAAALARDPGAATEPVLDALLGALDQEIARWEERSRHDESARGVLRAFLGVREIIWELRPRRGATDPPGERSDPPRKKREPERATRGRRVERVQVQG